MKLNFCNCMRCYNIILCLCLILTVSVCGCRAINKLKTSSRVKIDSTATFATSIKSNTEIKTTTASAIKKDTLVTSTNTHVKETTVVEGVDTVIHVNGDSATVSLILGDKDTVKVVETPDQIITIDMRPSQKLFVVKTVNKPKAIPVTLNKRTTTTTKDYDTTHLAGSSSTVQNDTLHQRAQFDSAANGKYTLNKDARIIEKHKSVSSFMPWLKWVLLAVVILYVAASLYLRSWNPTAWFARRSNRA